MGTHDAVAGSMATAAGVMGKMNAQMNPAAIAQTMHDFDKQSQLMGAKEEMMDDEDDEEEEEEDVWAAVEERPEDDPQPSARLKLPEGADLSSGSNEAVDEALWSAK